MNTQVCSRRRHTDRGVSLLEILLALTLASILAGVSIPQIVAARRLLRAAAITQGLVGGLRDARQMALSRRRAITFQYDDTTKQIAIIDHGVNAQGLGNSGIGVLTNGNYPNTPGSSVAGTISLTAGGVPTADIQFGAPPGAPTAAGTLGDKTKLTSLTNKKLNITFQSDGTVVDINNSPRDIALAFYNPGNPFDTASAVSILGATGRIKAWRYSENAKKYIE